MVLSLLIYLIVLGGVLYIVKLLPIDANVKQIINVIIIIVIVIALLQLLLGGGVPSFNFKIP